MEENKNKLRKVVIIGLMLVLLIVNLSGCSDNKSNSDPFKSAIEGDNLNNNPPENDEPILPPKEDKSSTMVGGIVVYGDIDKIGISDLKLITQERICVLGTMGWGNSVNGFVQLRTGGAKNRFVTTGTAKNIAGETINFKEITIHYLDGEGNVLNTAIYNYDLNPANQPSFTCRFDNVLNGDTRKFEFTYEESGWGRFSDNPFLRVCTCAIEVIAGA